MNSVIVIGGGLVGSLCAIFMAKRGYRVTLYEYRDDIRLTQISYGKSINLALSNRGRSALAAVGLEDAVLQSAIPMKGRMLHDLKGENKSIPYDSTLKQCIYSISRNELNRLLLAEAESYPNVEIYFNHKLINVDFEDETITLLNMRTEQSRSYRADLIIGADGTFSTLRRYMQLNPLFQFSQNDIEHGYLELRIPPENFHKMTPNHLHIWPRGEFMMIALPNADQTWTVTLFMPFTNFQMLKNGEEVLSFFRSTFPDAVPLIGEKLLLDEFFKVRPSSLLWIKCKPYHMGDKFLVIGDAAHAMVPFYGQGMNAGFEDCIILNDILSESKDNFKESIREFSRRRVEDAHAICDLALVNYTEMRDLVTKRSYRVRKFLDECLYWLFPSMWIPLYNSVTFSRLSYSQCIENRKWQNKILQRIVLMSFTALAAAAVTFIASKWSSF